MIDHQCEAEQQMAPNVFIPSHDETAEQSVIGSLLLVAKEFDEVSDLLESEHFHLPSCRLIYQTIAEMRRAGITAIDPVTIAQKLDAKGELGHLCFLVDGEPFSFGSDALVRFVESVPHAAHAKYYAKVVRGHWLKRRAHELGCDLIKDACDKGLDSDELVERFEKGAFALGSYRQPEAKIHIGEILPDVLDMITERMNSKVGPGVATHFGDIDKMLNGMRPSELIVVAARPGSGKTAFAANVALSVARTGKGVMFFSLEQSRTELAERYLCLSSGIHGDVIRKGALNEIERDLLMVTAGELGPLPLLIDDAPGRSVSQIASICRRHKTKHNLGLIVVDYLQLVEPEDKRVPREQQVAQMTRRLKCLAKEIDLPIIVLCQLNRAVESRDDKKPRLSDLRESGSIEQDANIVIFISRPELYTENDRPGEADITIAKNRAGSTGTVVLTFKKETMQFFDHAPAAAYAGRFEPSYPSVDF